MKTILVINGESDWQDFLPEYKVVQKKIQTTEWLIKNKELYVLDTEGVVKPDAILWRVGAIKPHPKHKTALELIKLSGILSINSAEVLLKGYDRLSMLAVLQDCDLPTIPFNVATNTSQLKNIEIPFPFVVKVGNYHGGYGKVLISNEKEWQDIKDLLFISEDYVSIEPYINYEKDIRYLAVGDKVWAMARKGKFWKSNVLTSDYALIDTESELLTYTKKLQKTLKADIIALDILQESEEKRFIVEYNDIPGFSGFPDEVRYAVAECISSKL